MCSKLEPNHDVAVEHPGQGSEQGRHRVQTDSPPVEIREEATTGEAKEEEEIVGYADRKQGEEQVGDR